MSARWRIAVGLAVLVFGGTSAAGDEIVPEPDPLIGWAATGAGVTGGRGGDVVTVTTAREFEQAAKGDAPRMIRVAGRLDFQDMPKIGSNKTVIGAGADALIHGGGFKVRGVHNIVIRNLSFRQGLDAIDVEGSHHVWIDHCDFADGMDGLVDIKRGSDCITVSWNRFHDHGKTCLLGHSDKNAAEDVGKLRVTYHHNFFDGTQTRHPRVRFAESVHVFNNFYRDCDYGVASTMNAGVVFEGNVLERVKHPTYTHFENKVPGRLVGRHNRYVESGVPQSQGTVPEPGLSYAYRLDPTETVAEVVARRAGLLSANGQPPRP